MNLIDEINAEIKELKNGSQVILNTEAQENVKSPLQITHKPVPKRGRGRPPIVGDVKFIELWNQATEEGRDLREVAKDLGIAPASASVRASLLRKKGKALKQFRRGRRKKI